MKNIKPNLKISAFTKGVGSLLLKIANATLALILSVVLARLLGVADYGIYAFAFAAIRLLAIPAEGGVPVIVTRETASASLEKKFFLLKNLWSWSVSYIVKLSGLVAIVAAIVLYCFDFSTISSMDRVLVIFSGIALVLLLPLIRVYGAALSGLGYVVWGQSSGALFRPLFLLCQITILYWLVAIHPTPLMVMVMHVVASVMALGIAIYLLWWKAPHEIPKRNLAKKSQSSWRNSVIPLALISSFGVVITQVDIMILGIFHSDSDVGVYRVVTQIALLIILPFHAFSAAMEPSYVSMSKQNDMDLVGEILRQYSRIMMALGCIPAFVFFMQGEELLGLVFGSQFTSGAAAMKILALGYLIAISFGPSSYILNMIKREKDVLFSISIGLFINLCLNVLLIPPYGALGASLATSASFILSAVLLHRFVFKRLGIDCSVFCFYHIKK